MRQQGQSVAAFVAELRRLSEQCPLGTSLDDMLRDKLVCGIDYDHIQCQLSSEPDNTLTLERAKELVMATVSYS